MSEKTSKLVDLRRRQCSGSSGVGVLFLQFVFIVHPSRVIEGRLKSVALSSASSSEG